MTARTRSWPIRRLISSRTSAYPRGISDLGGATRNATSPRAVPRERRAGVGLAFASVDFVFFFDAMCDVPQPTTLASTLLAHAACIELFDGREQPTKSSGGVCARG